MAKDKLITITIEQSDGKIFDIERPVTKHGSVCIGGTWLTPTEKDGKPYLFIKVETPEETRARERSGMRASSLLMALMALSSPSALGFTERRRRR